MRQLLNTSTLLAIILSSVTAFAPLSASAREGSVRSVGKGIKCYTAYTQNADGTYSWKQICYKGV